MKSTLLLTLGAAACCYPKPVPYHPENVQEPPFQPVEHWVYLQGHVAARADDKAHTPRALTPQEWAMVDEGFKLANSMLLSPCFQDGIKQATMSSTNDLTPAQVLELMTKAPPVRIDIDLYDANGKHGTIGYDEPDDPYTIHMNTYYVTNSYIFASNLLHEAAHARGFIHHSSREQRSVPYTMNFIFDACGLKKAPGGGVIVGA